MKNRRYRFIVIYQSFCNLEKKFQLFDEVRKKEVPKSVQKMELEVNELS